MTVWLAVSQGKRSLTHLGATRKEPTVKTLREPSKKRESNRAADWHVGRVIDCHYCLGEFELERDDAVGTEHFSIPATSMKEVSRWGSSQEAWRHFVECPFCKVKNYLFSGYDGRREGLILAVDPLTPDWSSDGEFLGTMVLEKIASCQDQGKGMPGHLFEAHVRSKKNISTEMVLRNAAGQVYLAQRPTREENPSEAYPGQWYAPGVTHTKNEFTDPDTFRRLVQRELGGVDFTDLKEVANREVKDVERGMYLLRIFTARVEGAPRNPKGRFFDLLKIPWDELVKSHRDIILPTVLGQELAAIRK